MLKVIYMFFYAISIFFFLWSGFLIYKNKGISLLKELKQQQNSKTRRIDTSSIEAGSYSSYYKNTNQNSEGVQRKRQWQRPSLEKEKVAEVYGENIGNDMEANKCIETAPLIKDKVSPYENSERKDSTQMLSYSSDTAPLNKKNENESTGTDILRQNETNLL